MPDYELLFVDSATNLGKAGLTPAFTLFKKASDGSDVQSPAITEIGGGFYKFTYAATVDIVFTVDGGAALLISDRYVSDKLTANDGALLNLDATVSSRSTPGDLTRGLSKGVQLRRIVQLDDPVEIYSGDTVTFDINLGPEWDLTGKKVWLFVKKDLAGNDATAIIKREYTVTDAPNAVGEITTTSDETKTPGKYTAEVKVTDPDGSKPETARRHDLKIIKSVRTGA